MQGSGLLVEQLQKCVTNEAAECKTTKGNETAEGNKTKSICVLNFTIREADRPTSHEKFCEREPDLLFSEAVGANPESKLNFISDFIHLYIIFHLFQRA